MPDFYPFSQKGCTTDEEVWEKSGRRGQRAFELAAMGLPIVPGFVLVMHFQGKHIHHIDYQYDKPS